METDEGSQMKVKESSVMISYKNLFNRTALDDCFWSKRNRNFHEIKFLRQYHTEGLKSITTSQSL